ncbi:hypothetical protein BaOVIS_025330 [Babesia ovis]|uniref:Uncharacterized protein n=1 Tax=Babesia ovis TaxID=5869 RepID=A0A9W5TBE3_BABOV|nr:hypothetical protein BaOVIS_025330 [Babesia ovis]
MSNLPVRQIPPCVDRIKELCQEFIGKLADLGIATGSIPLTKRPNRVDLKKALMGATRGRSITSFVRFLDSSDKRHLLTMMHMECPVTCPSRNVMLRPVESMPSNVMKSTKKLRNFFGIPESQICRGCVKRVRCRRSQQVERDVPDLGDIAAMLIGVYSTCKLHLKESPLVVAQYSLRELPSVMSVTDALLSYIQALPQGTEHAPIDEKERNRLLKKYWKMKEMKKVEQLKEKAFNLPKEFNITPAETTYMTSFQRELYNKLPKPRVKLNEDEDIWVVDSGDTTLSDEPNESLKGLRKLNSAKLEVMPQSSTSENVEFGRVQELNPAFVQFRMIYDTPIGGEVNILRYDIKQDSVIQGVKVNAKGRVVIDLDTHVSKKTEEVEIAEGLENYRPVSEQKASQYATMINGLRISSGRLPNLKRVNYTYQCQSSGGIDHLSEKHSTHNSGNLEDVVTALNS